MKDAFFRGLLELPVAAGAVTPVPPESVRSIIWSTLELQPLVWTGFNWVGLDDFVENPALSGPILAAALGDSITQSAVSGGSSFNQIGYQSTGFMTWAMAFSRGLLWCPMVVEVGVSGALLQYNRAISGETAEQIAARITEIDALPVKPRFVSVLAGTNNLQINPSQTAASIANVIIGLCKDLLSRRITPVLCTLLPRGNGTSAGWGVLTAGQILTARGRLLEVNRRLRTFAGSTRGVILADTFNAVCNFASATSDADVNFQPDYLHLNMPGAVRVGEAWWEAVKNYLGSPPEYFQGAGDAWHATENPYGSMLTAAYAASGGSAGVGVTGTVPAGCTANRLSGSASTAMVTQQPRADGRNGFETTISMAGVTDNATFRLYEGTSLIANANFSANDVIYFEQDIVFNGPGPNQFGNPDTNIRINGALTQVYSAINSAGASGDMQGVYEFRLRTPLILIPTAGITTTSLWSVDGIRPGGTATVTRRPPVLRKYDRNATGAITWTHHLTADFSRPANSQYMLLNFED